MITDNYGKYALLWAAFLGAAVFSCAGPREKTSVPPPFAGGLGKERYTQLMRAAAASNDTADWKAMEIEAAAKYDTAAMCIAKLNRVICLSNFASPALAAAETRKEMPLVLAAGKFDTYFYMHKLLVDCLMQQLLYDQAQEEAEAMFREAERLDYPTGKALSLLTQGIIYCKMSQYDKAFRALEEGIAVCPEYTLADGRTASIFKLLYEWGAITAFKAHDRDRLRNYASLLWQYVEWRTQAGLTDSPEHHRVAGLSFRALSLLVDGRRDEAAGLLGEAEGYIRPGIPARAYEHFYEARRELRRRQGDYLGAVADADTLLATHRGYFPFRLDDMLQKAELLTLAGRTQESAALYRRYIEARDSVNRVDIAARLDRLRTIYEVDRLETEKRLSQQRMAWAVVICLLLGLSLASYAVYSHRLREKSRVLYQRIREQQQRETDMEQVIRTLPEENLTRDLRLFMRLNELLRSEELFTDPALARDELASRLGTNRTYLSDAVRACADGATVREYLNQVRLKYAGRLLSESVAVSIDQVCHDAGFTSRSVFYRLFRERYGMSPARFRDLSGKA